MRRLGGLRRRSYNQVSRAQEELIAALNADVDRQLCGVEQVALGSG